MPFANGSNVESTSNGAVDPGVTPLDFPFAATDAVKMTPLSAAEYETEYDWLDVSAGNVIGDGLKLPCGLPPTAASKVAVRLSGVSCLKAAPAGDRLTVNVNGEPACTRTAGTAPPRPAFAVDATTLMPVGAITASACAVDIVTTDNGSARATAAAKAAIPRLPRGMPKALR
ncbi:MAG TPA: hypothetical protein VGJ38_14790 [Jatrophihabitantaceae bacterium]